jgi:2-keto-4-pentenoate hydratase
MMNGEDVRLIEGAARQRDARAQLLEDGAQHLGWKAGFGTAAARLTLDISVPLIGFLTDRTLLVPQPDEGPTMPVGTWTRAIAEAEIAVRLGSDLSPGVSAEEALAAVASIAPAIELADIDITPAADAVSDILAGDIFHRAVMLGAARETPGGWPTGELRAHVVHESAEGAITEVDVEDVEAGPGTTAEVLQACARAAALVGPGLRAGDVVILGSVLPPVPMAPGDRFVHTLLGAPRISVVTTR